MPESDAVGVLVAEEAGVGGVDVVQDGEEGSAGVFGRWDH